MEVHKSFYEIGIYDPSIDDNWPWHFHYENGVYLSNKYRKCSWNRAVSFVCPKEARGFYSQWKHCTNYKMELIESKRWVEVPDRMFPETHPRSILKKLATENVKNYHRRTAARWFYGMDTKEGISTTTFNKHRAVLLEFDIDIERKCENIIEPLKSTDSEWQLTKPKLSVIG